MEGEASSPTTHSSCALFSTQAQFGLKVGVWEQVHLYSFRFHHSQEHYFGDDVSKGMTLSMDGVADSHIVTAIPWSFS